MSLVFWVTIVGDSLSRTVFSNSIFKVVGFKEEEAEKERRCI
jgi:hypothetical protein